MPEVILFHSVLGLRPGVLALARRLTEAGHPTRAPDLYGGRATDDVDAGFRIHRHIGADQVLARARLAAAEAAPDAVLAGISMGAGVAGTLWAERPAAPGVLYLSGPGPVPEPRPSVAPIQMHMARPDPFDSEEIVAGWLTSPGTAPVEAYRYDGAGHNFLDEGGPDHDAAAAELCTARLVAFLDRL